MRESVLVRGGFAGFSGTYSVAAERAGLETPADPSASKRYHPVPAGDLDGDGFDDLFVWSAYEETLGAFEIEIKYGRQVGWVIR